MLVWAAYGKHAALWEAAALTTLQPCHPHHKVKWNCYTQTIHSPTSRRPLKVVTVPSQHVFKKKKKKSVFVCGGGVLYFMHFHAIYLKMQLCLTLVQLALACSCNCAFLIEGLLPNIHTNTGGALPSLQRALQWLAFISHLTLTLNQVYSLKT